MRRIAVGLTVSVLVALRVGGAIHYVNPANGAPVPPYASWGTAATTIQDAVDYASVGDQVLVTNGGYFAGSRVSSDGATNRVVVTNAITLQSVNGALVTTIDGGNTMRCVYLANGAVLSGFALAKGNAINGAGVYCVSSNAWVSSCQISFNRGKFGGGVYSGTVSNCTVSSNSVVGSGAGALGGYLVNCTINYNICNGSGATVGGGASGAMLTNCTLTGNRAIGAGADGGGANASVLNNCTLSNNRADFAGGGAYNSVLTNCTLVSNVASYGGGGVSGGTLVNCVLRNNTSNGGYGGGVYWTTTLINCTLVGNTAGYGGGGYSCTFYNCIIYYNSAPTGANTYGATFNYCCTPDTGGVGNTTAAPIFVNQAGGDFHLQGGSGAIDTGTNFYAWSLTDFDGNLRIANGTVDMGAFEYQQPNPANISIQADYTNVVVGITVSFTGIFSRGKTDSWGLWRRHSRE
jgi:hypothetical protein